MFIPVCHLKSIKIKKLLNKQLYFIYAIHSILVEKHRVFILPRRNIVRPFFALNPSRIDSY